MLRSGRTGNAAVVMTHLGAAAASGKYRTRETLLAILARKEVPKNLLRWSPLTTKRQRFSKDGRSCNTSDEKPSERTFSRQERQDAKGARTHTGARGSRG